MSKPPVRASICYFFGACHLRSHSSWAKPPRFAPLDVEDHVRRHEETQSMCSPGAGHRLGHHRSLVRLYAAYFVVVFGHGQRTSSSFLRGVICFGTGFVLGAMREIPTPADGALDEIGRSSPITDVHARIQLPTTEGGLACREPQLHAAHGAPGTAPLAGTHVLCAQKFRRNPLKGRRAKVQTLFFAPQMSGNVCHQPCQERLNSPITHFIRNPSSGPSSGLSSSIVTRSY